MPAISYRDLARRYQLDGAEATVRHLTEAIREKHLEPGDFSIRTLAESLVPDGREWVHLMDPRRGGQVVTEAEGVDSTAFANITGQLIFSKIMMGYEREEFVLSKVIPAIPTRLDGEKIPGATRIDPDDIETVGEGMPFPHVGFGERYITTPSTTKRGLIVPVTKEAIFFDRTNLVMARASEVGTTLGQQKEVRLIDVLIGATNNYEENGTARNTYQTSTPWINEQATTTLTDWTDVDAAELLFSDMTDPDTGYPIVCTPKHVVVTPAYRHAANRIFGSPEIRYTGSGAATETLAPNPMRAAYTTYVSQLMKARIVAAGETAANAAKWWFLGDLSEAFGYMENWPITVVRSPRQSEADFEQDIVLRWKASERGAAAVLEPRKIVKSYEA